MVTTKLATISAAEANRHFSKLLRRARGGESVVITDRGTPVAKLVPVTPDDDAAARAAERKRAWQELLAMARAQEVKAIGPWTRDELYED